MNIFISRILNSDSIFLQTLEYKGHTVIHFSLIDFSAVPFAAIPSCDWLFFYSKMGVQFFWEQLPTTTTLPQLAALGAGTAASIEKYKQKVDFIGTGEPVSTAMQFQNFVQNQRICFVQASNSQQSVQKLLHAENLELTELIVYENSSKKMDAPINAQILVFTSPLNAETFVSQFGQIPINTKVVAIGNTTAQKLITLGITHFQIADSPNEASLAKKVLEMLENF